MPFNVMGGHTKLRYFLIVTLEVYTMWHISFQCKLISFCPLLLWSALLIWTLALWFVWFLTPSSNLDTWFCFQYCYIIFHANNRYTNLDVSVTFDCQHLLKVFYSKSIISICWVFSFQRVMQTLEASLTLAMQTMAGASHSLYVSTTALSTVM